MRLLLLTLICAILASCSLVKKTALNTTGELIYEGSDEVRTEYIFENFIDGTPANLKMVEGLWFSDQDNEKLLTMLIKGYGAYAFAGMETIALKDILLEKKNSSQIELTLLYYQKAINYGLKYLQLKGIDPSEFWDKSFPTKLNKKFDAKLDDDDYVAIFYFAQSLGSSLNLQRTNIGKMAFMNHVQKMFRWVCAKEPNIEFGSCKMFDAIFTASLPSILGGDQTKARELFDGIVKNQPYNLLAQIAYVRFHLVPMMEEEEFDKAMRALNKDLNEWHQLQLGNMTKYNMSTFSKHENFNLFNAVAKKRYDILKNLRNDLL